MPELTVAEPAGLEVWRVGYKPDPWAWVGWEWATDGRFGGRWDDSEGIFRTIYAGSTLLACLLELLADFRPDPLLVETLDDIVEDNDDATIYPTAKAGELDPSWLHPRAVAHGRLSGRFCSVTSAESVATLHPRFVSFALHLGLNDFDAAALKDGRSRPLTQAVTDLDGINFPSRHGDDLELWAIFERPDDPAVTPGVRDADHDDLSQDHPDVIRALDILGLVWRSPLADDGVSHLPPPDMPLPIVGVSGDEVMRRHTVNGNPDPTTPFGAAFLWWQGLADPVTFRHALEVMSHKPEVWGDYTEAAELIGDLAIMTGVESNSDRSDIAYVKFIDYKGAEAGQVFPACPSPISGSSLSSIETMTTGGVSGASRMDISRPQLKSPVTSRQRDSRARQRGLAVSTICLGTLQAPGDRSGQRQQT